jgi:hypothetical protein
MLHYYGPQPYLAPRGQYAAYYAKSQFGGGGVQPAFGGVARQRGHGFGSLIGGLLRSAVPLLSSIGKKVAKTAGTALLSTGAGVLSDLIGGKSLKSSVSHRARNTGQNLLKRAANSTQGYINKMTSAPPAKRRATVKRTRRTTKKQQKGGSKKKKPAAKRRKKRSSNSTLLF